MMGARVSRRQLLSTVTVLGVGGLAGCGGNESDTSPTNNESSTVPTDSPDESPADTSTITTVETRTTVEVTTRTKTPTGGVTATEGATAEVSITAATVEETRIAAGGSASISITATNTGGAAGSITVELAVNGSTETTETIDVPAGEETTITLAPTLSETGDATISLNGDELDTITVEPPSTLHVAPDGDDANPGTEDEPVATIQAAVDEAGPGQTVSVHPGEYFEFIEFTEDGELDAPITLTGPPEAILKPPKDVDWGCIGVGANHIHITGLTISGLYDPDAPKNPESYTPGHLISLNTWAEDSDDYLEGLVVSPHRIGNAGGALINSVMIEDCNIGGFEIIGPAGAAWLFDEAGEGHYDEFVYLGTATDNRSERGYDEYDRTRNIRVHHIDNSAGHPHSELVDIKEGVSNVTVEYCTDAGGIQSEDSYTSQAVQLGGYDCTVRWNVLQNAQGSGVEIGPWGYLSSPGEFLAKPETEFERQLGKGNAIYGNVFTGNTTDAIDFLRESWRPGQDGNPLPEDQRALCDNLYDGYSDADPSKSCSSNLPSSEGVGHLGGESPWDGDTPTQEGVFEADAMAPQLETTVDADDVPTNTEIEATVTITNNSDRSEEVALRFRVREHVLEDQSVSVAAGETREVTFTTGGIPNPAEVWILRNGQKIGRVRVGQGG
jgi:hypothetical protein